LAERRLRGWTLIKERVGEDVWLLCVGRKVCSQENGWELGFNL